MKCRWLHLSDLHSYCFGFKTLIMKESLIKEIAELNKVEPFSFMVVTGDLSDKNKGYKEAMDFIISVMKEISMNPKNVFIVPGNHDLDRDIPEDREKYVEELWESSMIGNQEEKYIKKLIPAQSVFFEIYEQILNRKYPIDKVHFVNELNNDINIVNINTAWMCYDSRVEDAKLHIGVEKLYDSLSDIDKDKFNIAIGHHRLDDLQDEVKSAVKAIFNAKGINLYLGGHCHRALVSEDTSINTCFCFCKQARAEDEKYPAGFIVGNIDTEYNDSYLLFYNWSNKFYKWTYDYSVASAKHGKYYLNGDIFNNKEINNKDVIIDLKIMGIPLDYRKIKKEYNLENARVYQYGHTNIAPKTEHEWNNYLGDLIELYNSIIKNQSNCNINIFAIAPIPLLVSLGYLIQNDSPYINIYQYVENDNKWVFDEGNDNILVEYDYKIKNSDKLAVAIGISSKIDLKDIDAVINDYDLLSITVEQPRLSYLNYKDDVIRAKKIIKENLDAIYNKYSEIHLFLAAPAGLCIEIGRIIRRNMYPDTYVYNYSRKGNGVASYTRIYNLKLIDFK